MKLLEAIVEANQRAAAGDPAASVRIADHAGPSPWWRSRASIPG